MSEQDQMSEPAFAAIGLAVEPVTPPAGLRDRILSAGEPRIPVLTQPKRRLPWSLLAAAMVLISVAAFLLGQQTIHREGPTGPTVFGMAGHGSLQGAGAKVTDLKADRIAVVEFNAMPALPPGKVYELWLITADGHADPAGVFVPDSSGHTVVVVDRSLEGYTVMAVTVEAGPSGVSSPTQQPAMTGNIA
ncbi:MAG TPA: anti-sigma factor [Candidatus Dormibacteraeota bacterium]|nr:anti-sigma factor [Candidatus Dormibacteraeota bacterium]